MIKRCGLLRVLLLGLIFGGLSGAEPADAATHRRKEARSTPAHTASKDYSTEARSHPSHRRQGSAHRRPVAARNLPLIVIDPGHGGKDSGAVGASGTLEKNVTLATALELQRELQAKGRFRVELTRNRDVFVSLPDRAARARSQGAALFISIHADASPDRHARGASVYVRANTPGGPKVTQLPASSANSGAIGGALSAGSARPAPGSALLQYKMVTQLQDDIGMVRDPARQAHLYVLGTIGVPGVLVEMGFLSNRHEERLLKEKGYRQTISRAIQDAITDYFDDLAHPGATRT
jgi:N-acetylmuramoyl-L-alanine amidase